MMDCMHRPTVGVVSVMDDYYNKPPRVKKRSRGICSSDCKFITQEHGVKQHLKEKYYSLSNKKLLVCLKEERITTCCCQNITSATAE